MYDYHLYNTDDFGLAFTCAAFFLSPKNACNFDVSKVKTTGQGRPWIRKTWVCLKISYTKIQWLIIIFPIKVAIFRPTSVPRYAPSTKTCPG